MAAAPLKKDYDHLFKLVLIGDSSVGKSCLLLRFAVRRVATPASRSCCAPLAAAAAVSDRLRAASPSVDCLRPRWRRAGQRVYGELHQYNRGGLSVSHSQDWRQVGEAADLREAADLLPIDWDNTQPGAA